MKTGETIPSTTKRWLSKSDFLSARSCPGKLYFKTHGFPSVVDEDPYMEMLADGGFMIEKIAETLYSEGKRIFDDEEQALAQTAEQLRQERVTLFQPAILSEGKLCRIDVLKKDGESFSLIEVKSKSFDSAKLEEFGGNATRYFEKSEWSDYIEDVAFQTYVLGEKFPKARITSYLLLPDKGKKIAVEGMISWFKLFKDASKRPEVEFYGDPQLVRRNNFLSLVCVDDIVEQTIARIKEDIARFAVACTSGECLKAPISIKCRDCEYKGTNEAHPRSGFSVCWGERAEVSPHILSLGQLGNVNRNTDCINKLIAEGKSSIYDVPIALIRDKFNNRPFYQVSRQKEFLLPGFGEVLDQLCYPLHFVDFETSQMVVPYHAGMRPYQRVLFQWSCHTMAQPGAMPTHHEWINTKNVCPNVEFGETLRECVGDHGTILAWSGYESTQLRYLIEFLEENGMGNAGLLGWLRSIVATSESDIGRIVDLNKVALKYYFHPLMGARTSVKVTLPAVLSSAKSEKITALLKADKLFKVDEQGGLQDPYSLLPPIEIYGEAESVHNGSGAMRAYQEMLYGDVSKDEAAKRKYEKALLQYCKTDTLGMVLIWEHWQYLHAER